MEVGTCNVLQVDHHCHHLHQQDNALLQTWVGWTFVAWIDVVAKVPHHLPNQKRVTQTP
jgi:hypothetical protein